MSMQCKVTNMHCLGVGIPYLPEKKKRSKNACVLLDNRDFLFFSTWKVVFRCFEAPCEVWCKFTFSWVTVDYLYIILGVIQYTMWQHILSAAVFLLWSILPLKVNNKMSLLIILNLKLSLNVTQAQLKVLRKAENLTVWTQFRASL